MVAFVYPKTRHARKHYPPQYSNYRSYKPILRQEFDGRCVYCRLPDSLKGEESFGVDHYRPKKHFPLLVTEYLNLFYACNRCNSRKGDFWPRDSDRSAGHFVPNPCEHVMFAHLRYKGAEVNAHSETGKWTIEYLDLNEERLISYRRDIINLTKQAEKYVEDCRGTLQRYEKHLASTTDVSERESLTAKQETAARNLSEAISCLERLTGQVGQTPGPEKNFR